jgi:hypothetical protein
MSSYSILEMDDFDIVLLTKYSGDSKDELFVRERYYPAWLCRYDDPNNREAAGEPVAASRSAASTRR